MQRTPVLLPLGAHDEANANTGNKYSNAYANTCINKSDANVKTGKKDSDANANTGKKQEEANAKQRVADLKRRKESGALSAQEAAELQALEGRVQVLDAMASGGLDADAAAKEAKAAKARAKDLKKRQKAGKLTAESTRASG